LRARSSPHAAEPARAARSTMRVAARRHGAIVFLEADEILAFEAKAGLWFVHSLSGTFDIDVSLAEIHGSALGPAFARVHRSWLVNLSLVRAFEQESGGARVFVGSAIDDGKGIRVPVSRDNVQRVRAILVRRAVGLAPMRFQGDSRHRSSSRRTMATLVA